MKKDSTKGLGVFIWLFLSLLGANLLCGALYVSILQDSMRGITTGWYEPHIAALVFGPLIGFSGWLGCYEYYRDRITKQAPPTASEKS